VRSGLTLGVQSDREHYKFLFESREIAPLRRWAAHFGYAD
jgi:hypothetical protein